jgi:hypothetical protein
MRILIKICKLRVSTTTMNGYPMRFLGFVIAQELSRALVHLTLGIQPPFVE